MKGCCIFSYTRLATLVLLTAVWGCTTLIPIGDQTAFNDVPTETVLIQLASGSAAVDVYWPDKITQAPAIIIAHGFLRNRRNMSGWGQHLAKEGFVAIIPDLPTHSDHARNGLFLSELKAYLSAVEGWGQRIDPTRVGYLGFSAGGLSSLLAAARSPDTAIWIGLDPVDRAGVGANAAPMVQAKTVVLTAEPSACNGQGNARGIIAALPHPDHFNISGAVHVDAEWPTSWLAEVVCGCSSEDKRTEFRSRATEVLRKALTASF